MKSRRQFLAAFIVLCALGVPAAATAKLLSLPLTDDAYVNANAPTKKYGDTTFLAVNKYGPNDGLVRFDSAALAGQDVTSATFVFYLREIVTCGDIAIYPITANWVEEKVTWTLRPSVASTPSTRVTVCPSNIGEVQVVLTDLARQWADGSTVNYGLLLRAEAYLQARIDSKERSGGTPMRLEIESGTPSRAIVLDFNNPENCTIDAPGHYVLDRSWQFGSKACPTTEDNTSEGTGGRRIRISAASVTLDLRGFTIEDAESAYGSTILVTSRYVTIRNGTVRGADIHERQGTSIDARGTRNATIDGLKVEGAWLGPESVVTNSQVYVLWLGSESRVWNSFIEDELRINGNSIVAANHLSLQYPIRVAGNGNIVQDNVVEADEAGIRITGDRNIVARNALIAGSSGGDAIIVEGTANIIDANIVPPLTYMVGINFAGAGNYFGNNRVSATYPYVNAEAQVDWGGNVTF